MIRLSQIIRNNCITTGIGLPLGKPIYNNNNTSRLRSEEAPGGPIAQEFGVSGTKQEHPL